MTAVVRIGQTEGGLARFIAPPPGAGAGGAAPSVLDHAPGVDVAVLEVAGGLLTWSVLALDAPPVAVLDDADRAQEWVWAMYGEQVALALAADTAAEAAAERVEVSAEVPVLPALPALVTSARQLAFAHWASRWWPASVIDGIPPLDERQLDREIGELTEECDLLFAGEETADARPPGGPDAEFPADGSPAAEEAPRATDYALAAGPGAGTAGSADGLTLARGTGGSDWRRYPPGLVDASERAVSWEVVRAAARTTVSVSVVAAPGPVAVPHGLTPRATVSGAADPLDLALRRVDDTWLGNAPFDTAGTGGPAPGGAGPAVDIYLPGFGTSRTRAHDDEATAETRARVRALVRSRLARARNGHGNGHGDGNGHDGPGPLLRTEIAAATAETDF
ncbi:hypothetical protein [Streptomyces sp. 35G-GA-8]|uniref:hypothetical protein n=1 Tax=Streptomyces sp. 35G-GA-8 TaxID=2939434 RepID=UPI00201F2FF7|nr:hypothetical protein [Streptomyces sp. 35G-GA-8]MCL7376061.1 hypothetical protein [Streptomyces sp. 35G-GA-8]